ncbi:MAG: Crp/Fnr family transcriptional regulator [Proteobacteria bacterium]|nr:Crp/Fnr family transcriptional regulator [Pseudomonadota bacterium]
MDYIAEFKKCLIFSGLNEEDLKELVKTAKIKKYPKKSLIFSEGDIAKGFYVLLSGMVKIYRISPDSREQILHIINPHNTFAEAAIFIGNTYPAFAETILDSVVAFFDKDIFLETLEKNPKLSLNLIISLSIMLKKVIDLINDVSLKTVDVRLAEFLLKESAIRGVKRGEIIEFELVLKKTEIAKKIGTVNETLSRTLKKFKDMKILDTVKNKIIILNIKALQEIAEQTRQRLY